MVWFSDAVKWEREDNDKNYALTTNTQKSCFGDSHSPELVAENGLVNQ